MTFRKFISLSIALSFIVLLATGILSFYKDYSRIIATLHTVFGLLFSVGALFHLSNNFKPIKTYARGKMIFAVLIMVAVFFSGAYYQIEPFDSLMNFGTKLKASSEKELNLSEYEVFEMEMNKDIQLTIDLLRSEHYWHPQMAVWVEDTLGNYVETIFVSKATAQGLFFGGRSKDNFKEFDEKKDAEGDFRRVNALPVWSHKRGVQYKDGLYVPTNDNPLPDGITGATFKDNFKLLSSIDSTSKFNLRIEINVAFDDNEHYSEFDFPDDEIFHNGTGQLGQPSIIFNAQIDMNDHKDYYLMDLIGHGHRSGQTGELYKDLSTLTTAKKIVERIVIGALNKKT